ncbi:uncharacterized protein HMPREF1541_00888 [Cyphellophora europaea CBS 101466]|uniref:Impact N-terminal domain-containing protein n=1 Tax=Cyphellophora europaea (strain CBS 101466) TaxID=1220924 RepID=W2SD95_CYPE1|nr:uncharacterized protein HMPREF1541_00888 [Cyphellophora europaea CBS 101466]ETN46701.1 hypothetical protein HMPREF1541_00888 [Cyphellophora europaea CBS 101466]
MSAVSSHAEVQSLLRFLTKDARLPLGEAMSMIGPLKKLQLLSPEAVAQAQHADLKVVFTDDKILKQVVNAAKRVSNPTKRGPGKRRAVPRHSDASNTADEEAALALPTAEVTEDDLSTIRIETNRAPLFLAFALTVLAYTQADQPLSSRLSLAQAVVSAGAQSKAKYIGLTTDRTAEEDGWAQGQPKIRIMGRDIAVMRRHVPVPAATSDDSQETIRAVEPSHNSFWGIDLDALRKANGPLIADKNTKSPAGPPIHTPQAARQYLLKSMLVIENGENGGEQQSPNSKKVKKPTAAEIMARKQEAAAMVLKAIDIVCNSWKDTLTTDELDRRAQNWYALVRPDVEQGKAGWGQRGQVELAQILRLKRTP